MDKYNYDHGSISLLKYLWKIDGATCTLLNINVNQTEQKIKKNSSLSKTSQ